MPKVCCDIFGEWSVGTSVRLGKLSSQTLNGSVGEVVEAPDANAKGRIGIRLTGGHEVSVLPEKLEHVGEVVDADVADLAELTSLLIDKLTSQPDFAVEQAIGMKMDDGSEREVWVIKRRDPLAPFAGGLRVAQKDFWLPPACEESKRNLFFQAQRAHLCSEAVYLLHVTLFHAKRMGRRLTFKGVPVAFVSTVFGRVPVVQKHLAFAESSSEFLRNNSRISVHIDACLYNPVTIKNGCLGHDMLGFTLCNGSCFAIDITGHQFGVLDCSAGGYPLKVWPMESDDFKSFLLDAQYRPVLQDDFILKLGLDAARRSAYCENYSLDEWVFRQTLAKALSRSSLLPFDSSIVAFDAGLRPCVPRYSAQQKFLPVDSAWCQMFSNKFVSDVIPELPEDKRRCLLAGVKGYGWRLCIMDLPTCMELEVDQMVLEMVLAIDHAHLCQPTLLNSPEFANLTARTVLKGLPKFSAVLHLNLHHPFGIKGLMVVIPDKHPVVSLPVKTQHHFVIPF